jgi:hypothetical protein
MWTSTNHLDILGIIAHYISEEGTLQECLLAMKVVDGRQTVTALGRLQLCARDLGEVAAMAATSVRSRER